MKRSHDRFYELLPLAPQVTVHGREGKLFVNGDKFCADLFPAHRRPSIKFEKTLERASVN